MKLGEPARVRSKTRGHVFKRYNTNPSPKPTTVITTLLLAIVISSGLPIFLMSVIPNVNNETKTPLTTYNTTQDTTNTKSQQLNSSNEGEEYFGDILSNVEAGDFNFSSSDFNLSYNSDFYNELQNSYGTSDFCNTGCSAYDSDGNYVTISCFGTTNSCTAYSSNGTTLNTYCSSYINSCNTYSSNGDYYSTSCSEYTNSCNTWGSDGYSSNTSCSNYSNWCSAYDSNGGYSNTSCSEYTSFCNTYSSDGSSSTTYCSRYASYCTTY